MNEAAAACLLALPAEAPRDAVWWVSLGAALQRCHRIDDAIAAYMQSLALKMDDATVHFRLGMCFKDKRHEGRGPPNACAPRWRSAWAAASSPRALGKFLERAAAGSAAGRGAGDAARRRPRAGRPARRTMPFPRLRGVRCSRSGRPWVARLTLRGSRVLPRPARRDAHPAALRIATSRRLTSTPPRG